MSVTSNTLPSWSMVSALTPQDRMQLCTAVDRVEDLRGSAVVFCRDGRCEMVRQLPPYGARTTVVFEVNPAPPSPNPRTVPPARKSKMGSELLQLGLNCGGTALAVIGAIFFTAAAPVTGGASLAGTVLTGAAAAAGAVQCTASMYRVYNEKTGHGDRNDALDASPVYNNTMLALDVVGLAGAGGATRGAMRFAKVASEAGATQRALLTGQTISRPMRKVMTGAMGGVGRYSSAALTATARKQILEGIGVGLALTSSATGGASKEIVVYVANNW